MSFSSQDSFYMARAIQLAKKGWFTTRTNPRVGCVIVKNNQNIAEGWHEKAGLNHAEVNAIESATESLEGSTAYVTLEPCSHFGKRPPCSLALVKAGIKKVVCAMQDPNSLVAGQGFEQLRKAGVEVQVGLMEQEALKLNQGFIKRMQTGLPKVVIKSAMSVDGKVAMASGESKWVTSKEARTDVQRLRAESCAIITGSGTVIQDDPSMNVRDDDFLDNEHFAQPLRVVIDSQGLVPASAKIFQQDGETLLASKQWRNDEFPAGVNQEIFDDESAKIDLYDLLLTLGDRGVNQVLVEAGSALAGAFLEQHLVDELVVYQAPKLLGSKATSAYRLPFDKMAQSIELELADFRKVGEDFKFTYSVKS